MLNRAVVTIVGTLVALASPPALAQRTVAVAPLSTLGEHDTSASTKGVTAQLEAAIGRLANTKVVTAAQVATAIKRARKPQLETCDAEAACVAEVGKLVGAQIVIAGEVVRLGDATVIYLGATDVASARELRSTTLTLGATTGATESTGAVIRLLDPDQYRGNLRFVIDTQGATVYVNGSRVTPAATGDVLLPVGTQAVRVTHPAYHDFVRFIDVQFDQTTNVPVGLTQYPIVQRDLQGKPINRDKVEYVEPPVWRRWYVVGPAAVGLAILTGLIVGYAVHDLPDGECRKVGGEPC